MATIKAYKTCIFKLHNPSQRKRAMMMDCMVRAHRAYEKALNAVLPHIEELDSMDKRERAKWLSLAVAKVVVPLPLSSGAKASICLEVPGAVESYLALRKSNDKTQLPTAGSLVDYMPEYDAAFDLLAASTAVEDENTFRDILAQRAYVGHPRPVGFYKNRKADGFLMLQNEKTGRVCAYLNLHNTDSRFARSVHISDMVDVRSGEVMSFKSSTGDIFPLEFGADFQAAEYLKKGTSASARLVYKPQTDHFELHVAFCFESELIEPVTYLGVDRGIYNLAAFAVIDADGKTVAKERISGMHLRHVQRIEERRIRDDQKRGKPAASGKRMAWADEAVHTTANAIVAAALANKSRVVLEDLGNFAKARITGRKKGARRGGFNSMLNRTQYEKLANALEYKLACVGLPPAIKVSASYTSQTCPCCGHVDPANRLKERTADGFKMDLFRCTNCGHSDDADDNAARVIAIKGQWLSSLPRKKDRDWDKMPDTMKFESYIKKLAGLGAGNGALISGPCPDAKANDAALPCVSDLSDGANTLAENLSAACTVEDALNAKTAVDKAENAVIEVDFSRKIRGKRNKVKALADDRLQLSLF